MRLHERADDTLEGVEVLLLGPALHECRNEGSAQRKHQHRALPRDALLVGDVIRTRRASGAVCRGDGGGQRLQQGAKPCRQRAGVSAFTGGGAGQLKTGGSVLAHGRSSVHGNGAGLVRGDDTVVVDVKNRCLWRPWELKERCEEARCGDCCRSTRASILRADSARRAAQRLEPQPTLEQRRARLLPRGLALHSVILLLFKLRAELKHGCRIPHGALPLPQLVVQLTKLCPRRWRASRSGLGCNLDDFSQPADLRRSVADASVRSGAIVRLLLQHECEMRVELRRQQQLPPQHAEQHPHAATERVARRHGVSCSHCRLRPPRRLAHASDARQQQRLHGLLDARILTMVHQPSEMLQAIDHRWYRRLLRQLARSPREHMLEATHEGCDHPLKLLTRLECKPFAESGNRAYERVESHAPVVRRREDVAPPGPRALCQAPTQTEQLSQSSLPCSHGCEQASSQSGRDEGCLRGKKQRCRACLQPIAIGSTATDAPTVAAAAVATGCV
eukprot:6190222-Pleurochrysis_carterae.AAC.1